MTYFIPARHAASTYDEATAARELSAVLLPGRRIPWVAAHRTALIRVRLFVLALLFAAMTVALVTLDFVAFSQDVALRMAGARLLVASVLMAIAFSFRRLSS